MLLGNGALCKDVVFYTKAMLPAHTGWGNGCVNVYFGEDKVCL